MAFMRRGLRQSSIGLLIVVLALVSAPGASGTSHLLPCVGGGIKTLQDAGNSSGTVLVTWQEVREGPDETCASSVAEAAIGSPATGFAESPISKPGVLARPTGVFLDHAGDGWIVGTQEKLTAFTRYGPIYRNSGAWLDFRPPGGAFRAPIALPAAHSDVEPFIVGDGAGTVLLGWNVAGRGAYLQWGDRTGGLSRPHFFRRLSISSLGIDDRGEALIAGQRTGGGKRAADVLISGRARGFSRPRLLARAPRTPPRQLVPSFVTPPLVRVGPEGQALVMWQLNPDPGPDEDTRMLVYRSPTGRLAKPIRYPYFRLPESENPGELETAAIDADGRAAFLVTEDFSAYLNTLTPDGHIDRLHQPLTPGKDLSFGFDETLAANAAGEFVAAWSRAGSIEYTQGREPTALPAAQTISTRRGAIDVGPLVTISQSGEATAVWERLLSLRPPEQAIEVQTLTAGATPVQIALHQPRR